MIPILYESTETSFTSNGIGRLSDALECTVTEERNGEYKCELVYPVDGKRFSDITEGRILGVFHDETKTIQPFDIYGRSAPIDGKVTFYASHISYRLNSIVVLPQPYDTCAAAIAGIVQDSVGENPFTFYTNKNVSAHYQREVPQSARSCLGGEENSILDVFGGGEYEFDKWNVRLLTRRGSDTDVEVRYGKNLTDFEQELDFSDAVNGIMPYWYGTQKFMGVDVKVAFWLPERVLYKSGVTPVDGRNKVIPYDFSDKFEEKPTGAQLRSTAQAWLDSSDIWLPSNSIKVDFVRLSDTEEYKDVAPLQQVKLCDTVLVTFPKYNIEKLRIKIVRTVYNVLAERYDEMELGDPPQTFADSITAKVSESVVDLQNEVDGIRRNQFVRAVTEYARSSSPSQFVATTTWSESLPSYVAGEYYWQRTATYYADGSVYYSDPIYSFVAQASGEANAAADNAHAAATEAERIAQSALDGVSEVEQHFWYDSTGAHIAENAGDLTTGASQTIASTGTVMMRNGKLVTSWTGDSHQNAALNFYDCSSGDIRQDSSGNYINQTGNLIASYARAGTTFYVNNSRAMALTGSALSFYDPSDSSNTDPMAVYGNGGIQLGKTGSSSSGKYNLKVTPSSGIEFYYYTELIGMISQYVSGDVKALRISKDSSFNNRIMLGSGFVDMRATNPTTSNGSSYVIDLGNAKPGHIWTLTLPNGRVRQSQYYYTDNSTSAKVVLSIDADTTYLTGPVYLADPSKSNHYNLHVDDECGIYCDGMSAYLLRMYDYQGEGAGTALGNTSYITRVFGKTCWTWVAWTVRSDMRLKKEVESLTDKMDNVLLNLDTFSHKWKDNDDGRRHVSVSAQQLQKELKAIGVDPAENGLVTDDGGYLGVTYTELVPALIHLCQTQQKQIDEIMGRLS